MPEPVSSTRNPRVVAVGRLHRVRGRRSTGLTIVEGPNVLSEAVEAGAVLVEVFGLVEDDEGRRLATDGGGVWIPVTEQVLLKLASTENPRGPVATVRIPESKPVASDCVWLDVADPGNAGTLIRTAAAFGLGVVFAPGAVDPWSPKAVRSGAGGHFRTPVSVGPPPDATRVATVVDGGVRLDRLGGLIPDAPVCILIGNEAHGLPEGLSATADIAVTIPMPGGLESLNAAVAGSLVMAELVRSRGWVMGSDRLRTGN